ncbi:MAG: cobalamin-dependent protein [Thermoleophilia bacterium]|nr:cobalamin-dependent protein [Thermoleophilia bacterium]
MDLLGALSAAIVELDEDRSLDLTEQVLAEGATTPLVILKTCQQAMRLVGERYERGEYALAALILAGEVFRQVYELVQPEPVEDFQGEPVGVIVLGTVAGDIHDIGKNMFGQALRTFGFTVVDLGEDVKDERLLEAVRTHRPDVLCLSGLISIAFESMKRVVDLVRADAPALGYMPPIVLGGGTVDSEVCQYAGADSWSTDAMEGVRICEGLVADRGRANSGDATGS